MTIDIGSPAINRGDSLLSAWTYIDLTNPADYSGKITSVEIYARSGYNLVNCEVATFFLVSGSNYSTRGTHTIGAVSGGSKQTFSGLDIDVEAGDFIGIHFTSGHIEFDTSGGSGVLYKEADYIPCTNETFSVRDADGAISVYGIGTIGVIEKSIAGSFGFTGVVGKLPKITLGGAFDFTGSIGILTKKVLSGVFGANGILSSVKRYKKALSGVLTFTKASLTAMIPHNYQKIIKAIANYTKTDK